MIDGWHVDQVDRRTFPPENTTMNLKTEKAPGNSVPKLISKARPDAKTQNTTRLNLT